MANSRSGCARGSVFIACLLAVAGACAQLAEAQQQVNGFAVERFYPSAPGGGWFVMDDLSMDGKLGGAISFTSGYARNPLEFTRPGGMQPLAVVSGEAFVDVGVAVTHERFRVYLNFPVPLAMDGTSGTLGAYQLTAPAVSPGTNPDTISDPRLGFDMRLFGKPGSPLRLGAGAQLIFPAGSRTDYVSDARYRGMLRFLAAGDSGGFSYAGQLGVHLRPLNDSPAPGSPAGNEFLFGVAAGRRFTINRGWIAIIGPEFYGETAARSFFGGQTGMEGLMTGRLEGAGDGRHLRIKLGIGHGLIQNFGAPEWRVLCAVELFGHK